MSRSRFELPTFLVAIAIYAGWLLVTAFFHSLPLIASLPAGALLLAWHGSLQHEAVHGHPTPWPLVNTLVAGAPLGLWLPLPLYRDSHLAHHRSDLTDPLDDPESYYVTLQAWQEMSRLERGIRRVLQTLAGRLLLGPAVLVLRLHTDEARRIARSDLRRLPLWLMHVAACAAVLTWVVRVCDIPVWQYLAVFVYPGLALTLLRSFAEHRPDGDGLRRSAVVEAGPLLSLVFLHNNLHAIHHREPGLPWYQLPARFRALRNEVLAANGGYWFRGYLDVLRRFSLTPKDSPVHPGGRS